MSDRERCALCGRVDHDVRERLVEWTELAQRDRQVPRWQSIFRCPRYQECRARAEADGRTWPVRDAVTRPTVTASPEREEVPV